ncbi:MAG TPA: TIGR03943 family protein [Anaerolineales bacterium]|nr:TIGR03943 family protein [Anaerolineales bacterium]
MSLRVYRFLQALILLALVVFIGFKLISGTLSLYINMQYMPLTVFGIALLVIMMLVILPRPGPKLEEGQDHDAGHGHDISPAALVILIVPLLVGVLIPVHPLDATAAATRGMNVSAPLVGTSQTREFQSAADTRNILDWIVIFNSSADLSPYVGQSARVTGFVYHDPRLPADQFIVSRFVITCCTADASAIGMIVDWNQSADLKESSWVEVKGPVQASKLGGQPIPLIEASYVQATAQPDQPYLYP